MKTGINDLRSLPNRLRTRAAELAQAADQLGALSAVAEHRPAARRWLERIAVGVRRLLGVLDEQFGPRPGEGEEE
jgi:hypothetical protein